jgi:hypothetical protein
MVVAGATETVFCCDSPVEWRWSRQSILQGTRLLSHFGQPGGLLHDVYAMSGSGNETSARIAENGRVTRSHVVRFGRIAANSPSLWPGQSSLKGRYQEVERVGREVSRSVTSDNTSKLG